MAPKVKSPATLAHVVLKTSNFEPMLQFWKTLLGAESCFENETAAFLRYDEEHHRIAIINMPSAAPRSAETSGLDHIAFAFSTLQDLTDSYTQRKAAGILPTWCVNHGPTTSLYYEDPDGNKIEFQVDNFDTVEAAVGFMTSNLFKQNFIGTDFDPEDLIRRLRAGEDEMSIKKRVEIGPRALPEGYGQKDSVI
ncbi:catechol 2,3-dioxygenase [Chlorociboria aeruginascens]|nr:catechol 2,3-dioxygenase [Chlorociboria aeruginascens]